MDCMTCIAKKQGSESVPSTTWIKDFIKSTMQEMMAELQDSRLPEGPLDSPVLSGEDSSSEEESLALFATDNTARLIKKVRSTMDYFEEIEALPSTSQVTKRSKTFPVHSVMKELMKREWKEPEKAPTITKRHKLLFPIQEEELQSWEAPPKVDIAIARLSKKTVIPVEDGSGLKDPMDRKADSILKRSYTAAVAACKPALAASGVARSTRFWLKQLDEDITNRIAREELSSSLSKISMAIDFLCDATVEGVKLSAKAMALSTAARRALWLRNWSADAVSKNSLCTMAFEPGHLFGAELDKLLESLSSSKGKRLPQENFRRNRRSFFRARRSPVRDSEFQKDKRKRDNDSFRPFRANKGGDRPSFQKKKSSF
ncbi:lamina-associated polypeptide 2, isoforms alpha/zeta-like [Xenopus laevis]|uniref:Lamina-associated polypeptide 2, isoforms alpha/zeta-like n=1 Tax=Xenopus laevis TaxID=8355 RepID=A0A8J1MH14_XENLA|nr:lamina-associated polypeptide 2, isoforms alpha/zeta-like [Xenopus laevis]